MFVIQGRKQELDLYGLWRFVAKCLDQNGLHSLQVCDEGIDVVRNLWCSVDAALHVFVVFYVVVSVVVLSPLSGRVVQEEALSAVTSAPELPHNKTRCFQKNESRIDFSSGL